jgi:predicted porin
VNKKLVAVAVSGALVAPFTAHAVKYKLSGQVNRAVVFVDDGIGSGTQFVDNTTSGTRWRMVGSEDIGNGMKVGFNWEWQNSSNPSSTASVKGPAGGDAQSLRKAEIWFNGGWGKLTVGQGDGAGNGTTEIDLSDAWNAAYYQRQSIGGGAAWRTDAGGTIPSGTGSLLRVDTTNGFDAFSRYDRVRYDTPRLGPVTLAASAGQDSLWEVAARASPGLGGGELSAGLFYGESTAAKSRYGGSASYLLSQGTNITIAGAINDPKGAVEASNWYVKLGHKWGNNAVVVAYGRTVDFTPGFTDDGIQVAFNHNIPKAKVDVYAGFNYNTLDVPAGALSAKDISAFVLGTKLKFD